MVRKIHELGDREETDARNSPDKPESFEEKCAKLFNNPDYNPTTNVYSDLHAIFSYPIELTQSSCPTVTPQKIKEKLSESRAKVVMLADAWHSSGNGSSQLVDKEENPLFGHFESDIIDGDDRAAFLPLGARPHILYMWQLFDENQMLHYTMAKLPKDYVASSNSVPLCGDHQSNQAASKKRRKEEAEEVSIANQKLISESMSSLAKAGNRYILQEKKNHMENTEIKFLTCDDSNLNLKAALKKHFDNAVADYKACKKEMFP